MADLRALRERYARELMEQSPAKSEVVQAAFAKVPREQLSGPPPWRLRANSDLLQVEDTDDPALLYADTTVSIDRGRFLNSGAPGLWTLVFSGLDLQPGQRVIQIGTGLGYYSAILAEIVGPQGSLCAWEFDAALAEQTRAHLAPWPQVEVHSGDGANAELPEADAILFFCGATRVQTNWLDALAPEGQLFLPLTINDDDPVNGLGFGMSLHARRKGDAFEARMIVPIGIFPCSGARTVESNAALHTAHSRSDHERVKSLRLDAHDAEGSCWLHATPVCISSRPL